MRRQNHYWEADQPTTLPDPSITFVPDWGAGHVRRPAPRVPEEPPPCPPEPEPTLEAVACPTPIPDPPRHEPEPAPSARPAQGLSGIPLALVVALSIGGGGLAVAALDRMTPRRSEPVVARDGATKSDITALMVLSERGRDAEATLAERLTRLEARPKEPTDPLLLAELQRLREKVEGLERDAKKLNPIPDLVEAVQKNLDKSVQKIEAELALIPLEKPAELPKPVTYTANDPAEVFLKRGSALFARNDYASSRAIFQCLTEADPSDARAWYFLALTTAFATNGWNDEACTSLFRKGAECEKQGTPDASRIDAAFASVTQANGKDWIAYYRSTVKTSARP